MRFAGSEGHVLVEVMVSLLLISLLGLILWLGVSGGNRLIDRVVRRTVAAGRILTADTLLRRAVARASPIKLEPIMAVEVLVPEENLGAVIGDLRHRRAHISDVGNRGDTRLVAARAPLRHMFGYSTDLRSLGQPGFAGGEAASGACHCYTFT